MKFEKQLLECYGKSAQTNAALIYIRIPLSRTHAGKSSKSSIEMFTAVKRDTIVFKVYGCRAFAQIDKSQRRKNRNATAFLCILWA